MASNYKKTITLGLDYAEFEGGIKECNHQMKMLDAGFKGASAELERYGSQADQAKAKEDYLTKKIEIQTQKVEENRKRLIALTESGEASDAQIERATKDWANSTAELNKYNNELDEQKLKTSNVRESLALCATVLTTVAAGWISCAKAAAEYADEILTTADQVSISTDTLQEWAYAADLVDVSTETMTGALTKLTMNMKSAEKGSGDAADAFKQLHVKIRDAHGEMRDSEDVYYDVIDALGKIKNETEQDQLAMAVFGKSAASLTGVINAGSEGLKGYAEEAQRLGRVMSREELEKAGQLQDAFEKFDMTMQSLKNNLAMEIVPALTALFSVISAIPTPVLTMLISLASVIAVIVTLANAINSVSKAGGAVAKLFTGEVNTTFLKTVGIILAVVAALTALAAIIMVVSGRAGQLNGVAKNIGSITNSTRGIGYNAGGTNNWRGGQTWVGEGGPELVDLPAGSRIQSNSDSRNAGSKTYNITMNCDLSKMRSVADVVDAVEGIGMTAQCGGAV